MRPFGFTHASWMAAGLLALMTATRFHHEGTAFALPDASLAVFFLAGWYLRKVAAFAGFLLVAGVIDFAAIEYLGVSDYCVTPAYGFLVPTYAVLWWVGRWAGQSQDWRNSSLWRCAVGLPVATTIAFLVSNGSFFLLSGKVSGVDWLEYGRGILATYPEYLSTAVVYGILVLGLDALSGSYSAAAVRQGRGRDNLSSRG